MSTLGDQLRTIAAQVDQLQGGGPSSPGTGTGAGSGTGSGTGTGTGSGSGTGQSGPVASGGNRINYRQDWNDPVIRPVPMGPHDELVIEFTTGSVLTTNDLPHIVVTDYRSTPRTRESVLSDQAGDFSMAGKRPGAQGQGLTITSTFGIGEGGTSGYYPALQPNTTYYLNVRNAPGAAADGDVCDVSVNLIKAGNL